MEPWFSAELQLLLSPDRSSQRVTTGPGWTRSLSESQMKRQTQQASSLVLNTATRAHPHTQTCEVYETVAHTLLLLLSQRAQLVTRAYVCLADELATRCQCQQWAATERQVTGRMSSLSVPEAQRQKTRTHPCVSRSEFSVPGTGATVLRTHWKSHFIMKQSLYCSVIILHTDQKGTEDWRREKLHLAQ